MQTITWCGQREVVKRNRGLRRKKKGKSKILSRGFCLRVQKPSREPYNSYIFIAQMQLILCSSVKQTKSADRTMDKPFFFRYKHLTFLKNVQSPAPSESLTYWLQSNFAATSVLNYWLREFPLSKLANRFKLRCEPNQLMLLHYKTASVQEVAIQMGILFFDLSGFPIWVFTANVCL